MELTPEQRSQQLADASIRFEDHGLGRGSKLEAHRVAIVEMRRCRWPYRRIADWLQDNRDVETTAEGVRSFCRVRGIKKGTSAVQSARDAARRRKGDETVRPQGSAHIDETVFDFDESKPLETWKSRTGVRPE